MKKMLLLLCFPFWALISHAQIQDTVYWLNGDTSIGKITFKKENNRFYVGNIDASSKEIEPAKVNNFVCFDKASGYERQDYFNLLGSIYKLEFGKNAQISVYSRVQYKAIVEEGSEPSFQGKKEYCFFKKGVPYILKKEDYRRLMLSITSECEEVNEKFRKNRYKVDDCIKAVMEYNNCGFVNR